MPLTDASAGIAFASSGTYDFYNNAMTNWFMANFPDAKNNSTVLLPMIQKQPKETVGGKFIIWQQSFGRNTGVQNLGNPDGTNYPTIPTAGKQQIATFATFTRTGMGTIAIDGETMRNAKTNGGAIIDPVMFEMSKFMDDMAVDRARQVHNDGSGRLAEISSSATDGTFTLKVNSGIEGATNTKGAGTLDQQGFLEVGMRVAFLTSTGTVGVSSTATGNLAGLYIKSVATSGNNVTITVTDVPGGTALTKAQLTSDAGATIGASSGWLVRAADRGAGISGSYIHTAYRAELTGIAGMYSDADIADGVGVTSASQQGSTNYTSAASCFQGVVSSAGAWNQAVVLDNSGSGNRTNSFELMQQALSDAERRNNANIGLLMSSYPTYDQYVSLAIPDKRYNDTLTLQTGHTTLSFNGIPWVKDRFCYQNRVYFMDLSPIALLETTPVSTLNAGDMNAWERVLLSSAPIDKYWRGWVWRDQLACINGPRERLGAILTELTA